MNEATYAKLLHTHWLFGHIFRKNFYKLIARSTRNKDISICLFNIIYQTRQRKMFPLIQIIWVEVHSKARDPKMSITETLLFRPPHFFKFCSCMLHRYIHDLCFTNENQCTQEGLLLMIFDVHLHHNRETYRKVKRVNGKPFLMMLTGSSLLIVRPYHWHSQEEQI